MSILTVQDLNVRTKDKKHPAHLVKDVSFTINRQEIVACVGESGSGKSLMVHAIFSLLSPTIFTRSAKKLLFLNKDLHELSYKEYLHMLRNDVGFIFQNPMNSFNPTIKIGVQLLERITPQLFTSKKEYPRVYQLLRSVKIDNPEFVCSLYPSQLSGGMLQRVMIAMAIAPSPKLIIADEPTTSLDVGIQHEIIHLLKELSSAHDLSIFMITHDFSLLPHIADTVCVMKDGSIVESNSTENILCSASHDYTKQLLSSMLL